MCLLQDRLLLELAVQYGVSASLRDVVHLDSSSAAKFSRHVIVRLPHAVFRSNEHVSVSATHCACQCRYLHFSLLTRLLCWVLRWDDSCDTWWSALRQKRQQTKTCDG